MEEALRTLLLNTSAVTNLCGTRIDWGGSPQGTASPRIALWVISDNGNPTLTGPDGLSAGRVQADCYGTTYASAKTLARAVRAALDGYRGGNFRGVFHVGTRDRNETGSNEADRPHYVQLDFMTHWRPTS
jgi:hypothetical protein